MIEAENTETLSSLYRRLVETKTSSNEPCAGFRITPNKKQVRMSEVEMSQSKNKRNVLGIESLIQHILMKSQEEEYAYQGKEESKKGQKIKSTEEIIENMALQVIHELDTIKKEASRAAKAKISMSFSRFLQSVNDSEFEERLDRLLSEEALESDQIWKSELSDELMKLLNNVERDILAHIQNCRDKIYLVFGEAFRRDKNKKYREVSSFLKGKCWEFEQAKRRDEICFKTGGITKRPDSNEFGVLSAGGSFGIFEAINGQLLKEMTMDFQGWKHLSSSVEFSPTGTQFLLSISSEKRLMVFESSDFEKKEDWVLEGHKGIERARWIDENKILASFGFPGELVLFKLGTSQPVSRINPMETVDCAINDFDLSENKREAFCGSDSNSHLVFKVVIGESDKFVLWKHNAHKAKVYTVRVSENEKHILSSGRDHRVILASALSGGILSVFKDFSHSAVYGVVWCPGDYGAVCWSGHEIVLLGVNQSGESALKQVDRIQKEVIGEIRLINSIGVFWGDSNKDEKSFLIVGAGGANFPGRVYKVELD